MAWMTNEQILPLIRKLADDLAQEQAQSHGAFSLIGLQTGGVWLAQAIASAMPNAPAVHELDVSFYRDDIKQRGLHAQNTPSRLPLSLEGHHLVLVDDVLFTGRTVRAAINEVFDRGRPARIQLAVLVDRGGRQLPIQADYTGLRTNQIKDSQMLRLRGPEHMELEIEERA